MIFLLLLGLTALSLAGAAAYFSVYGLALTFSGAFWAVVIMGSTLEAGKLIAASYLHRYWNYIKWPVKAYLISGILAVMLLTSVGVFGYLSAGYQAEMIPMKQMSEQLTTLEAERQYTLDRRQLVETAIRESAIDVQITTKAGNIDRRAVQALKQVEEARLAKVATLEPERVQLTDRLSVIDTEIFEIKTKLISHEATIGPIIYIGSAFDVNSDNAVKYMILLIIFAFDPMAVVLILALNTALEVRRNNRPTKDVTPAPDVSTTLDNYRRPHQGYQPVASSPMPPPPRPRTSKRATVVRHYVPTATVTSVEDTPLIEDPPHQELELEPKINDNIRVFSHLVDIDNKQQIDRLIDYHNELVSSRRTLSENERADVDDIRDFLKSTNHYRHLISIYDE